MLTDILNEQFRVLVTKLMILVQTQDTHGGGRKLSSDLHMYDLNQQTNVVRPLSP